LKSTVICAGATLNMAPSAGLVAVTRKGARDGEAPLMPSTYSPVVGAGVVDEDDTSM
jgi:hypothetical protein